MTEAAPTPCPVCGKAGNIGELVPFLTGPGPQKVFTWLHHACWPAWFKSLQVNKPR